MTNTATVKEIKGDIVIIECIRRGACGDNCSMCGGCSAEKVTSQAYCDFEFKVGDKVCVNSNASYVLFAMVSVFIFPIIIPLSFYFLFSLINKILAYVFLGFGIVFSLVIIVCLSKSKWFNKKITPKIVSVLEKK